MRSPLRKKKKTKDKIIKLRQSNPFLNGVEIGKKLKVSKQYVSHILQINKIPIISVKRKETKYCLVCGNATPRKRRICPGSCSFKYYNILVNCAFCRVEFYRKRAKISNNYYRGYKNNYCSRKCYYRGQRDST